MVSDVVMAAVVVVIIVVFVGNGMVGDVASKNRGPGEQAKHPCEEEVRGFQG